MVHLSRPLLELLSLQLPVSLTLPLSFPFRSRRDRHVFLSLILLLDGQRSVRRLCLGRSGAHR